ncbi:MAG: hypothetical protein OEV01_07745 [Nitrospira sp.]|nr:hypothetical protein [Nitrospira sp.]
MKRQHVLNLMVGVVALACVGIGLPVQAQVTPFDLVGHIQKFTLDTPMDPFSAAKLTVNGIQVTIPRNLVIQFPAAYFTAQQVFENAQGVSKHNKESGLALGDKVPPLAAFEVAVAGNIVDGEYRAGLVSISQQSLNNSAGFIHGIDVTQPPSRTGGMMCVGASPTATTCQPGDTRIRLNDPALTSSPFAGDGRYGRSNPPSPSVAEDDPNSNYYPSRYPDPRFTVDQGNPTVHALTGYPMCVPRSGNDLECPNNNRPVIPTFVMGANDLTPPVRFGNDVIKACPACDDSKQAPVKVGDYVTFAGTLAEDAPGVEGRFISVHTLVANVGIYTKPGGRAYVSLDESLLGTRGPITVCASAAECQDRLKIEGFTTDPSRRVSVYAVDVLKPDGTPGPGTARVRLLHSTEKVQAVFGRFRYVPPLTSAALFDFNGDLKGATRELMVRIDDPDALPDGSEVPVGPKAAHGLVPGIYIAPVGEYIFPEPTGVQGGKQPVLNFQCLAFLAKGWALPDNQLPSIARLSPWPGPEGPKDPALPNGPKFETFSCTQE